MPPPERPAIVRYGYGVVVVIVALGVAVALHPFDLEGFLFVIAVAVAVWIGGRGPGILAVVLSVLVLHYVFIAPERTGSMLPISGYFVVFSVLAALITTLSEARHRAERSLLRTRDDLEQTVQERTAEIRRQAELLHLAHDAVIVRDPDDRITFWNRGAEETYGWTSEEARGRVIHDLLRTTFPTSLETIEVLRQQGRWEGELAQVKRDGRPIVVASRWSVQQDERGASTLEINRDITDRKRAEQALRIAEAELAHVTRVTTLGEVTASFAHEVNQPLAAITNNANACLGMVPNGPELDEVRDALTDIVRDAERASAIVQRVRALATRSASEKAPVRLEDVVEDVVVLAAAEAAARRVTIRTDVHAGLPIVSGDRVQLQQVVLNLLVNGMDAMGAVAEPERLLEIRGRPEVHDGGPAVTISVQDHGIGLGDAEMGRLFEPFYTTKPQGMGMGLAISRSIIEAHGGRLWAEPNRGPGATFSFTLPAAPRHE